MTVVAFPREPWVLGWRMRRNGPGVIAAGALMDADGFALRTAPDERLSSHPASGSDEKAPGAGCRLAPKDYEEQFHI